MIRKQWKLFYLNIQKKRRIDNALFVEMNRILEEAMGKIMHLCPDIETSSFPNMQIECPFCGKKSDAVRYAGKSVTLKCTDCKKYFRVNLEELSVEPLCDNLQEEQKKGEEKTDSHGCHIVGIGCRILTL